jgi:hypothetical protein
MNDVIDFNKISSGKLTPDFILRQVSDTAIVCMYHGKFKLNERVSHPFRKDSNPSAVFFISNRGQLCLYDFVNGEVLNCFRYVMRKFNCNFYEALKKIAYDFGLIDKKIKVKKEIFDYAKEVEVEIKKETLIQFTYKPFTKEALKYWSLFEIEEAELKKESVFQVDKLWLNKNEIHNRGGYLRFAKIETWQENNEPKTGTKIYSPENQNLKWLSSIPLTIPMCMNTLQYKDNRVLVEKSFKDAIIAKKFFSDVIAVQSENPASVTQELIIELDAKFDIKIYFGDPDPPGIKSNIEMAKKGFNIDYCLSPELYEKYKIKDHSDYVKTFGLYQFEQYLKEINLI